MQVQSVNSFNFNRPNFTAKKNVGNTKAENKPENKSEKSTLKDKLIGPAVAAMFLAPVASATLPSCVSHIKSYSKTSILAINIPLIVPNDSTNKSDTVYITDTDTIYIPSVDTIFVPSTDTIYVPKTDTIYENNTDTIYINSTDTIYVPTTDTIYVSDNDTIYVPTTDTIYVPKTDTVYVENTDTIYVPSTDTIYVPKTDTIYLRDTIYVPTENFEFPREIHDSLNYWRKDILDIDAKGDDGITDGKALLYASAVRDWYYKQPEYIKVNLAKSDATEARFDHFIGNDIENDIRITIVKPGDLTVVKKDGTVTDQISGLLFNEDGVKTFAHSVNGEKIVLYSKQMSGQHMGKYLELGTVEPGYLLKEKNGQNILLNGILAEGTEDHYTNVNSQVIDVEVLEDMANSDNI